MMRKAVAIVAAMAVLTAGATGAWWWKHKKPMAAAAGDAIIANPDAPFSVTRCAPRLHEDKPALALMFSQPVNSEQGLDQLIEVTDLGAVTPSAGARAKSKASASASASASAASVVKGAWVLGDNPHVLVFPYVTPGHNYHIKLAANLAAVGGRKLADGHSCDVVADEMAPSFFFASKGTVLPAGLNGGLPVVTVNVPEVDVEFLRIAPEKMPAFMDMIMGKRNSDNNDGEQGEGDDYDYWSMRNGFKGQTSGWQLNSLQKLSTSVYANRFQTSDVQNARKTVFLPVEKIPELQDPGIYVAVMRRPGNFDGDYQVTYFYTSDIGLHVRRQLKQTDVFTTSLKSGKALSGITLEVLGEGGKLLQKGQVDGDGHGVLPGLPDNARLLLARRDKEMSVVALREPGLDLSEFDIGGHLPRDVKLFAYAGRDLYRPGEKFTLSVLARTADGTALPPAPIKVELKKPGGDVVNAALWQPNPKTPGYLQQVIDVPADAATGKWTLELKADPAAKRPDAVFGFQVEEFLPEKMKLTLKSGSAPLSGDDPFEIDVQGDYLYGAPAAGNRLLGSLASERARIALPKEWPGFIFGDVADDADKQRAELEETTLDEAGKASITVPYTAKGMSPLRLRTSLSLLESGGRPVVRSLERQWWPKPVLIGLRPLFDRDVAREGSLAEFELIRVGPDGRFQPLDQAPFRLVREDREYYWRFEPGRGWHSGYTEQEEAVQTGAVALKARAKLGVPVNWGRYRLEVTDPKTGMVARYRFYAGWNAQDADSIGNRPDRVRLELSGAPVTPGGEVKLKIVPPHDGEALVMVEADKVLWSKRIGVSAEGTTVDIPIDKAWNRADMYISTVVFRPGSQGDRVTPARAVGMTWLPLQREARRLKLALTAPAQVAPDHRMKVKLRADGAAGKAAMVTLSAVDVGILNITSYKSPDPFDFFFGKHRFGAELSDMYGKLIERLDGTPGKIKWGGDAGKRDTRSMPKKVKLVDLFSGPVQLDAKGEAEIALDIPDFNGSLRLMAVAATADAYGQADKEVTVAAPIVAELSTPRFISPGDQSTLALDVTNMMADAQSITVKLAADKLLKLGAAEQTVKLAPRQRQVLRFTVEPTEPYGLSRLTLDLKTAGAKPETIHREFALQVQPPVPREQDTRRVRVEPGATAKLEGALGERFFRGSATLSVTVSAKQPLNVKSLVQGLLDYPYGCLEQTTSAAYPHVLIDEATAKAIGLPQRTREQRAKFVEGAIGRIAGMQGAAGGYRLWSGDSGEYERWLTPYVTSFLLDAREAGFTVPDDMLKKADGWMLENLNAAANQFAPLPAAVKPDANGNYAWRDYELVRNSHRRFAELAHMGYMLAREQKAPLAILRLLHDQYRDRARSPLPLVHLGIALKLMGDNKRAESAIAEAMTRPYGIRADWEWEWFGDYGTPVRDLALAYALMVRHQISHPQREVLLMNLGDRLGKSRYWYSTQERIAMVLAARAAGGSDGEAWEAVLKTADASQNLASKANESRALDPQQAAKGLTIENKGKTVLWVDVEASGYPLKPPAPGTDKIALERRWFTADGKPWKGGALKVGDMLLVRVIARAQQDIEDGLVVDHIPAGLEVENLNLSKGPQAGEFTIDGVNLATAMADERIKHVEFRDDRFVAAARLGHNPLPLFYLLRVVTPGRYTVPGTYAEDMYRPQLRAFGPAGETITVVDGKSAP